MCDCSLSLSTFVPVFLNERRYRPHLPIVFVWGNVRGKKGVRYRSYVSIVVAQGCKDEAGSIRRVPAPEIEKLAIDALRQHMCKEGLPGKTIDKELVETQLHRVVIRSQAIEVTPAESPRISWLGRSASP